MIFSKLQLRSFRSYDALDYQPAPGVTVLYGQNGAGKTNLLEAMHLLSLGRSHRSAQDREMIKQGSQVAVARCETMRIDGKHDVEVRLYPLDKPSKRVLVGGKPAAKITDMMGHATCVMFSPEDTRIVRDGPSARRRFLDMQLSQIRPSYLRALKTYLRVLDSRNALLKQQRLSPMDDYEAQLATWDEQLAGAAVYVVDPRIWFMQELSENAREQYALIADGTDERLTVEYTGVLAKTDMPYKTMLEGLHRTRREDEARLFTCFGPHRDDFRMLLNNSELRAVGSQGQMRSAVLSLKLGELALIKREMGEYPALLLDDVFSELDQRRRQALFTAGRDIQTFITCTDREDAAGARAEQYVRVDESGALCVSG